MSPYKALGVHVGVVTFANEYMSPECLREPMENPCPPNTFGNEYIGPECLRELMENPCPP